MRIPGWMAAAALATLAAVTASAATFVVPPDEQMVDKATAIVIGTVEGSYVQERDYVETVYELRVERTLKGAVGRDELLRIVSPGGALEDRGTIVPGSAHFVNGQRVLLFLTFESQSWLVTDMVLGKFRFAQTDDGERVLLRDEVEIHGWDRDGTVHRERVRREEGFLRFIETRSRGRHGAMPDYFRAADLTVSEAEKSPFSAVIANAPFRAYTYTDNVRDVSAGGVYRPTRWSNIAAGVPFYKNSAQNIPGAADGGVSVIQNGLAAWTSECGSVINLFYGGTTATGSAGFDNINVVEFNDPQNRIGGSWTGAGTVATTFLSYNNQHSFDSMTWWSIGDADVVFQNGYAASNSSFATAMTHEIGHGIGWRHSNGHYIRNADFTDAPCNAGVEECSSSAIMNSAAIASLGFTLQTWDINASQATYPGGSCGGCTAPAITAQPTSRTITAGQSTTLTVSATGTSLSYQWYQGTAPNTASPAGTGPSLTVAPSATTSYWVRVSNACGTVNSATATVTVTAPPPATATQFFTVTPCRVADTRNGGPIPGEVAFAVVGRCGIPSTAKAVSLNVTAVVPQTSGFMTVYPTGTARPGTSTLNYEAGKTRANNAIIILTSSGQLTAFSSNVSHVILDVNGYFQ